MRAPRSLDALGRVGPRLLDQRGDHRRGLVGLRVPLHAEREAAAGHLERLGQVVDRGPPGHREPLADPVDALVVVRLGGMARRPGHLGGERPVGEAHVVVRVVEAAEDAPVVAVAEVVGQVLHERPAARHVHQLHAAADAEERQVALERPRDERELEGVALRARCRSSRGAARRRRSRGRRRRRRPAPARRSGRAPRRAGRPGADPAGAAGRGRRRAARRPRSCGRAGRPASPRRSSGARSSAVQRPMTGLTGARTPGRAPSP